MDPIRSWTQYLRQSLARCSMKGPSSFILQRVSSSRPGVGARDPSAPAPKVIKPPPDVMIGDVDSVPALPGDDAMFDTLSELREALEPIIDGSVEVESLEARETTSALRTYLQSILGATITMRGEQPTALT